MGKIHHDPRYPHQDGEVLHVGKGPKVSHKIQKEEGTPQDNKHADRRQCFWDRCTYRSRVWVSTTNLHWPHIYSNNDPHRIRRRGRMERKSLGKYCKICDRCGETHCWCNSSNWEEGLINVDDPNSNPSIEKIPSPTVGKPPVGWSTFRHRIIMKTKQARPPSLAEEASTNSGISMK